MQEKSPLFCCLRAGWGGTKAALDTKMALDSRSSLDLPAPSGQQLPYLVGIPVAVKNDHSVGRLQVES